VRYISVFAASLLVGCASGAQQPMPIPAAGACHFISKPTELIGGNVVLDFENLPVGPVLNPMLLASLEFSAGPGLGIVDVSKWSANGTYVTRKTLLPFPSGAFMASGYTPLTIKPEKPVRGLGLGWFDPNEDKNRFEALDAAGNIVAAGSPMTGPTGGYRAAFVGVFGPDCAIASVRVIPASPDDWYSIDEIRVAQ